MFKPTEEQISVIDAIKNGDNTSTMAYAGSGKTSTIMQALEALPKTAKVLLIYFNSAARNEARDKLAHLPNVKVATNHTYAYAAVATKYPKGRIGGRISSKRIASLMSVPEIDLSDRRLSSDTVAAMASQTIRDFTQKTDREIGPWNVPFSALRNLDPSDWDAAKADIVNVARDMWRDKNDVRNGLLPLAHDDYLKIWALSKGSWFFGRDLIIMDEGQDANAVIMGVLLKHTKAQLGIIGDPYQNLYDWRGTVNGLDMIPDATKLHLTQTHRFGGEVVDAANVWLSLLGAEYPLIGNPSKNSEIVTDMTDPDLVLNRTNAGVMTSVINLISQGRTFSVGGGTDAIRDLAEAAESLLAGKPTTHDDLIGFNSWPEVQKFATDDPNGSDLKVLVDLVDAHGTEKLREVASMALPMGQAETHVSTVHKVKGLEAPKVAIGEDFTSPDDLNGRMPADSQLMTAYVAVTRAQQALYEGSLSWGRDALASL